MSQYDDFDVVEEEQPSWYARPIVWVGVVSLVVVVAFVAGIAFSTANRRVAAEPTGQAVAQDATATPTSPAVPGGAAGSEGDATSEATAFPDAPTEGPSATPTETSMPTETPTETPPAACSTAVDDRLSSLYEDGGGREGMGCPQTAASIVWSAWEPFERGSMLWRSDTDRSYAFLDNGSWGVIDATWPGGDVPSRGSPPPGLMAPERGFGYVWSTSDALFNALGWARDSEKGFCALVQNFEQGFLLQSDPTPSCTGENLYNYATAFDWDTLRIIASGSGQGLGAASPAPAAAAEVSAGDGGGGAGGNGSDSDIVVNDDVRSPDNGIFVAQRLGNFTPRLDGDVSEWGGGWSPIAAVSLGRENWQDAADLSGDFQTAWSPNGLLLAVRVVDETYRDGPNGTQMYRGDGLEIHFDRRLGSDFTEADISDDDYQLGLSFGPNFNSLRAYRWYPYNLEEAFRLEGAAVPTERGYQVEALIPWRIFEVNGDGLESGQTFGFNVSINDNDGNAPEQQSVVSASLARTTYDDPTEWGTLVLN